MSRPTTKKLFPIERRRYAMKPHKENAYDRKPDSYQGFGEWDQAADFLADILENAYYEKLLPRLQRELVGETWYKAKTQCIICYMKTISGNGPLPELGRCDFCPGGDEEHYEEEEEEKEEEKDGDDELGPRIRPIDVL